MGRVGRVGGVGLVGQVRGVGGVEVVVGAKSEKERRQVYCMIMRRLHICTVKVGIPHLVWHSRRVSKLLSLPRQPP